VVGAYDTAGADVDQQHVVIVADVAIVTVRRRRQAVGAPVVDVVSWGPVVAGYGRADAEAAIGEWRTPGAAAVVVAVRVAPALPVLAMILTPFAVIAVVIPAAIWAWAAAGTTAAAISAPVSRTFFMTWLLSNFSPSPAVLPA
jgi:hypothetical protein